MSVRYLINFDLKKIPSYSCDLLIIGGGIAGLTAALIAADRLETTILTKGQIKQSSTWYAQGGIAAAIGDDDSVASHFEDTLAVGGDINNRRAVQVMVEEAPEAVDFLISIGTNFDRRNGRLQLAKEGGHSHARVLHAGDSTGSVIAASLGRAASAKKHLSLKQNRFVIDLLTDGSRCVGAVAFDTENRAFEAYVAPVTLLATGGMGQLYKTTTNPLMATGDGFVMAARAGAEMEALEFIQFHPTAFFNRDNPRFLISEALRGEGAYLRDIQGKRFMANAHPLAELAPRDIVSCEITAVMKRSGTDFVLLDATHLPADKMRARFPKIYEYLKKYGYDLTKDLIPVSPAAHYMIGGVKTDINGCTSIPGLFAGGEVASTGVHGANRLASNSLLEGLVFSRRAARHILNNPLPESKAPAYHQSAGAIESSKRNLGRIRAQLQKLMWEKVGIVREKDGLLTAQEKVRVWLAETGGRRYNNPAAWEVQNMLQLAELIIDGALSRRESVGAHYRVD